MIKPEISPKNPKKLTKKKIPRDEGSWLRWQGDFAYFFDD